MSVPSPYLALLKRTLFTRLRKSPRYRVNKFLLSLNGQWPYQEKSKRNISVAVTFWFHFTGLFGQIQYFVVHWSDPLVLLSAIGPLLFHMWSVIKIFNSLYFTNKMRQLLARIFNDWNAPMGPEEEILAQFADDGRLLSLMYTGFLYAELVTYLILSTLPRVLTVKGWANITTAGVFPFPFYFTANDEDYYIFIQPYVCIGITIISTTIIAVDGMFVVLLQHGCGIFAAVSYRLDHLVDREDLHVDLHPRRIVDEHFWTVVDCIKKHNEAIKYADDIAAMHCWSLASVLLINMLSMSFTGVQVMTAASPDSIIEALRQILFALSQVLHLFFENLFCQKLTDQSFEVSMAVVRSKWYLCSMRTRVLLQFMLVRSSTPWEMKAGKLCSMSMANFSAVIRTSLSYLTILATME